MIKSQEFKQVTNKEFWFYIRYFKDNYKDFRFKSTMEKYVSGITISKKLHETMIVKIDGIIGAICQIDYTFNKKQYYINNAFLDKVKQCQDQH